MRGWQWVGIGALGVAIVVAGSVELRGQVPGRGRRPGAQQGQPTKGKEQGKDKPKAEQYRGRGVIESIEGGALVISADKEGGKEKEKLTLKASKEAKIRVRGLADPSFLQPNQLVQVRGMIDKKGLKVREGVKGVLIFTPNAELAVGMFEDSLSNEAKPSSGDDALIAWKPYILGGTLLSIQDKKLTLSVPGFSPKTKIELVDNPKYEVNIADVSVVQAGDKIDIHRGSRIGDVVTVQEANITMAKPLAAQGKKPGEAGKKKGGKNK